MPYCKSIAQRLSDWFATEQGGYMLMREQVYFDHIVSDIFGCNALQLGIPEQEFLRSNRIPFHFNAGNKVGNTVRLCCSELPFDSDCLDLVLLPHVLEFSEQPHQVLRDVVRTLRPEGNLYISGFNPRSLWGLHCSLGRRQGYPWQGKFISLSRQKDWLALLGLELVGVSFAGYALPFKQKKWLDRCAFMETAGGRWWKMGGGVYFLHAVKRVPGMRLIKPKWNRYLVGKLLPAALKSNNNISQHNTTDRQ